jgi:8-hydroxy-5-deazaflavin:NADPH oxidoreductase
MLRIGIIGAGNIGGTLTRRLTTLGHEVRVANSRGPESLADLARETGATPVDATQAADGAEVVVVTIPEKNIPQLPKGIVQSAAAGAAIVDTGNYYPRRDGRIAAIEDGLPESAWVEQHLGRPVTKAFNNIGAQSLLTGGLPAGTAGRIALPVAGDDPNAKAVVMALIEALGFDPIDAGSLAQSWRQQPGTPVYVKNLDADGVRAALATASPERLDAFRA